jgi:hypothetical protein
MRTSYPIKQACYLTYTLALFATIALPHSAFAAPPTVRFLPAAGFNTGASTNNQYGGNLANFDQPVFDHGVNVGSILFDYDTYGGTPGGGGFTGGGALAGKFVANNSVHLPAGVTIAWAQTVTATISGANVWGAAANTEFPDTANKADPAYPFQSLPGGAVAAQPSANFQDFPNRFPNQGAQNWLGELALICEDTTNHKANVIESFLWGFGVTNANPGTLANITTNTPHLWGAPTQSFLDTETNSFDGNNGSTLWTFDTAQSFVTPEPGSVALGAAGLFLFSGYGWRRNRRKQARAA